MQKLCLLGKFSILVWFTSVGCAVYKTLDPLLSESYNIKIVIWRYAFISYVSLCT